MEEEAARQWNPRGMEHLRGLNEGSTTRRVLMNTAVFPVKCQLLFSFDVIVFFISSSPQTIVVHLCVVPGDSRY